MKLIWFLFSIEILMLGILNSLTIAPTYVGLVAVLIHVIISYMILMVYKNKMKLIFIFGYLARIAFMFWDLFARDIYVLPHSGADSEMFYHTSVVISKDLSMLGNTRGGLFSDIIGLLFNLIGDQRVVAQYINVLLGLSIVFIIYKILQLLNIDEKIQMYILAISAFFPNSIIMSAIFLREIIPTFLVTVSLLQFIKWFQNGKVKDSVLSFFYLGFASMFHSGVIGIAIGYFFALLFYDYKKKEIKFSLKTLAVFIILFFLITFTYSIYNDLIFGKFRNLEDITDVYHTANVRLGGSTYLNSISINSPIQLVIYGPLKSFFFLTSPLPFSWRGFMDVFSFFSDSSLYLYALYYLIKDRKGFGDRKNLIVVLVWSIVGASLIFGIGVSNAGTAIRHRQKIISFFLILLGVLKEDSLSINKV